jgi:DNA-binding MarR family transcriptional regulator
MAKLTPAGAAFTELVLEVFRVNGLALDAGDRLAKPAGLSSARWQVLGVVDHAPAPVADVARAMGLARQSVQQTADALAADGFVGYAENPHHRRAKLIEITAEGRAALRRVEARQAVWANRLGEAIALRDLQALVKGLGGARQRLEEDAAAEEAAPPPRDATPGRGRR